MDNAVLLRDELRSDYELALTSCGPLRARDSIIVYGAGRGGQQFLAVARECKLNVLFVCDDQLELQNGSLEGVPLAAPEAIRDHLDVPVIIALAQYHQVVTKLKAWGVRRRLFSDDFRSHVEGPPFDYVHGYFDAEQISDAWPQIHAFDRLLADEHSRLTLRSLLRYRLTRSLEHALPCPYRQYRHPQVHAAAGDVMIEGGAWTGDTTLPFAQAVGPAGQVFAFEPAPPTFAILQQNVQRAGLGHIVTPVNLGLGSRDAECRFAFAAMKFGTSRASDAGELTVHLTSLDNFCQSRRIRPTLIKMDIEGAEPDAIQGARHTIETARPKLQICIYHKPADLWEIPLQIHAIFPSYRFYLGHHERELAETVLYAVCPDDPPG